jgi:S-adenosylmethionine-diacylglycerol 3-amino-3-carboxypropyl transferase
MADSRDGSPGSADFSIIRYAQCWEDAETLLAGLDVRRGDVCVSIGSGGENSLSLLSCGPGSVIAVDVSPAQNACLELKIAGFRVLSHADLLEMVGVRPSRRRLDLFERVRSCLSPDARAYWDANRPTIAAGMVDAGKFEAYFRLFRRWVLPLIHRRRTVNALLQPRPPEARRRFYEHRWNNWQWRALFHVFFSRAIMGRLGRDPQFFKYVEGRVASPIFARAERALTLLDPSRNAYLHWIVRGEFGDALPHAWRAENYAAIRDHLDRLEIRRASMRSFLAEASDSSIDRFNLSDIFEYLPQDASDALFQDIARCGRPGGRVAYWNMQAPRRSPAGLAHRFQRLDQLSHRLHSETATFFYTAFHVEELV